MQKKRQVSARLIVTCAVFMIMVGYALANNIVNVTMSQIVEAFDLSGARQGMMGSMSYLGCMIALLLAPLMQGRIGKAWVILMSAAMQIIAMAFIGVSSSFTMLLCFCVLLGAGGGLNDSFNNSYIVDLNPENSARLLGFLHGFYGLGGLLTPILIGLLMNSMPWQDTYGVSAIIFGAITIAFVAIILLTRRQVKVKDTIAVREEYLSIKMLKQYLLDKRNLLLLCAGMMYVASQYGIVGWIVRYMKLRFDAETLGATAFSIYWLCTTVSRFVSPQLPFPIVKVQIVGIMLSGIAHILGVVSGSAVLMIVAIGLIGLLSGQSMPVLFNEAARGNAGRTSLTTSFMMLMMGVTRMLMPLLMGAVTTSVSVAAAMLLPAAAALFCSLFGALAAKHPPKAQ